MNITFLIYKNKLNKQSKIKLKKIGEEKKNPTYYIERSPYIFFFIICVVDHT